MPQGLETWHADGTPSMSVVDRLTRKLGVLVTGTGDGFYSVPMFSSVPDGYRWIVITSPVGQQLAPIVWTSAAGVHWMFRGSGNVIHMQPQSVEVTYGIY